MKTGKKNLFIILISYLSFISLGLPDGLLGVSWPYISARHQVPLDSLGILLISFVAGYLLTSTTSGKLLTKISLGLLLTLSCCVTGVSLLAFAFSDYWFLIIVASFFLGSGGGAIDTSINTFASSRFSASTINWLHAFYGIGATSGPFIITWMLVTDNGWYNGYIVVAIVQITLSLIFVMTLKFWKVTSDPREPTQPTGSFAESIRLPFVWITIFIFFLYSGLEIGVGQWLFTILTESRNIAAAQAGLWTSAYWGSLTLGRIIFGFILTRLPVHGVIIVALIGIVTGSFLLLLNASSHISLMAIILIGFSNAPVFPCLISVTPKRVGLKHTANIIGFQISAAMVGGALLPALAGLLTDYFGWEVIPITYFIEAVFLLLLYLLSSIKYRKVEISAV